MSKLAKYLNQRIIGNVFDAPTILEHFSTDRSILKITPRLVAFPETLSDVQRLVRFSNQLALRNCRLPITVRGTGLDKTGACLGDGMILSTARLSAVEELDPRGRLVRTQSGATLRELNAVLSTQGLCLPIDANPDATIGGLIANAVKSSKTAQPNIMNYLERVELVLASGDIVQFGSHSKRQIRKKTESDTFEGKIYRELKRPDLLPLLAGSQGTLGIIIDVILRVEPMPDHAETLMVTLHNRKTAFSILRALKTLEPTALDIYDLRIMERAAENGNRPELFNGKIGHGWLALIKFTGSKHQTRKKLRQALKKLPPSTLAIEKTTENTDEFLEFEIALNSYLNDNLSGERTAIMDDLYIPNHNLTDLFDGLNLLEQIFGRDLPVFGSYLNETYHIRPEIDLTSLSGRQEAIDFMRQCASLVKDCDGRLAGSSPVGRTKATNRKPETDDLKNLFDPNNILNPDVRSGASLEKTIRNLRTEPLQGVTRL